MKRILKPLRPVYVADGATVVGHEEHAGPLGAYFDLHDPGDDTFGQDSWERAESEMIRLASGVLLGRRGLSDSDLMMMLTGDLQNQCTASAYGMLPFHAPYIGLYGACSTAAESLLLGSLLAGSTGGRYLCAVSSHYASAERQFRFPMEYGGQRTPTAQWTVTGAGAFLLSDNPADCREGKRICLTEAMAGAVVDRGITDAANMGAAMAPAVLDTVLTYLRESGRTADSFDWILTGDLGAEGVGILRDFAAAAGVCLDGVLHDCGLLIYDREATDKHAGGSGCGCSATVMAGYVLEMMRRGEMRDILFIGSGAMMSPARVRQGDSIAGIAHLVRLTAEEVAQGAL